MDVRIVEVGPRDGLQNISAAVPTAVKLELIKRLRAAGLQTIELTSVVSPKAIPQLADHRKILAADWVQAQLRKSGLQFPVLIPNRKGLSIAQEYGITEVAVFVSATEGFSKANINCSVEEGLRRAEEVAGICIPSGVKVRGYVSCIFADPFDGPTPQDAVLFAAKRLLDMGCYEISLGDTLGVGVPNDVRSLLDYLFHNGVPPEKTAAHFHDTYGQALGNAWEAFQRGVRTFDSSVSGLGGCPFAPGAQGNVATEDLVYLFENAGIHTGVDIMSLAKTGAWISQELKRQNQSRVGAALLKSHVPSSTPSADGRLAARTQWTTVEETSGLKIFRHGRNMKIVLNRPENGNALTTSMILQLIEIFERIATDESIRRVAIIGTGRYFCTGMDLGKQGPVAKGQKASDSQFARLTRLLQVIDEAPQVTIAALNGPAFGGSVGLVFVCDIRVGLADATVTLSEVKLGLCPATISRYVIREWGKAFAREAMLSGRPVPLPELQSLGVVARTIHASEGLEAAVDDYLQRLKIAAPRASAMCKALIRANFENVDGNELIRSVFDDMMRGGEGEYGLKEFQAGRRSIDWDSYSAGEKSRL